jgi:hypothetical protein
VLRVKAQLVNQLGDRYRALRLAEAALLHAQRAKSRLGNARVQALLAGLCEVAGLSGKADRYRQGSIQQMRELGDRRATSELLLTLAIDPAKGATVPQLQEAATLAGEIGWGDGLERAMRNTPTLQ